MTKSMHLTGAMLLIAGAVMLAGCDGSNPVAPTAAATTPTPTVAPPAPTTPAGKPCGPYGVELASSSSALEVVINALWSNGQAFRDKPAAFGSSWFGPLPTGWLSTVFGAVVGLPNETHTLKYDNVKYSPRSFTLTIDGKYTCALP